MCAVKRCLLLLLPPELRERIFEYALCNLGRHHNTVDLNNPLYEAYLEPGLLSTCRRIRHEALAIFYMGNKFIFWVTDCDARSLIAFENRCKKLGLHRHMSLHVAVHCWQGTRYDRLREWCMHVQGGGVFFYDENWDTDPHVSSFAILAALQASKKMRMLPRDTFESLLGSTVEVLLPEMGAGGMASLGWR